MSTDGKNLNAPDIMRGLIKYSVIALGTIAGLVILTVGLLQAPSLRQAVLSFALTEINKGDTKIAIGDLSGQWPSHIHLTQVTVSDADGIWLSVDEADINWSPLSLLRGQVFVEDFSAQGVAVARLPSSGDNAEETSPGSLFDLPTLPVAVKVEKGTIKDITLARGLVAPGGSGTLASLDLTTSIELTRNRLVFLLEIARNNGRHGAFSLSTLFAPSAHQLTLSLSLEDGDATHKGLIAELTGLDLSPLKLTASAHTNDGKLSANMQLDGGKTLQISGDAQGVWNRDLMLAITSAASGNLIADALSDLDGANDIRLDTDFLWSAKDDISLSNIALKTGALTLDGKAKMGDVTRAAPHPLTASGNISGLDVLLDKPGNESLAALQWSLDALVDMREEVADVSALKLLSPVGLVEFVGTTSLDGSTIKGEANATFADLAPLGELIGEPLSGAAIASFSPFLRESNGNIVGDFIIRTENVKTSEPALTAFIETITADGNFIMPGSGGVKLPSFRVTPLSGAYSLNGNFASTHADILSGEIHFDAANIGSLLPEGQASGATKIDAKLSGTRTAPEILIDASLTKGSVNGTATDALTLNAHARSGQAGPLTFRFKGEPGTANLDATLDLPSEGGARLSDIKANLFGSSITGNASLDSQSLLTASIDGAHVALAPLAKLAGVTMSGTGDLSLRATPVDGKQTAALSFNTPRLDIEGITLDRVTLDAALDDLFGTAQLDAKLNADSGQIDLTHLDNVDVSVTGPLGHLDIEGSLSGILESASPKALTLTASSVLDTKNTTSLALNSFDLKLGSATAMLAKPTVLNFAQGIAAKDLQIDMTGATGKGSVSGDISIASAARIKFDFERMPVDLLTLVVPADNIAGSLDGTFDVDAARSRGTLALQFSELRIAQDIDDDRPAFNAKVDGAWAATRLDLTAIAQGVSTQPFTLKASLPVTRPQGAALPTLAKRGRVEGSLLWDGPLEALVALASLDGQRATGNAKVALIASGDISAPVVGGNASVAGGSFENFSTGTLLRDIEMRLDGRNSQTLDFTLSATDGEAGRINGKGTITLDTSVERSIDISLNVENARLVKRSDLDATIDGALSLTGPVFPPTLDAPATLSGSLSTRAMHIRIPESLPADVPLVEVIEINGGATASAATRDAKEDPLPLLLDLSLSTAKPARISGRGLDSLWNGKLAVAGRIDEPLVKGQLNSERGTLEFASKTFKLTKGNVTFPGTYPIAPRFVVTLLYSRNDFEATINVSGSDAKPDISLSSSPSLPRDEILSRILFDKGVGELSALETLQLARTLAELSGVNIGVGGPGIMDRIQETLSLDVLRIDSGASGATTVSAGKYIQEGVYVGVEQGTLASDSSVKVEIDVTPQISVETRVGQNASSEVGVNWKWDY